MNPLGLFERFSGAEHQPWPPFETLILQSRRALSRLFVGEHDSPLAGEGLEFLEIDDYAPGESVRRINWRASARAGHPVVNRFASRRRMELLLVYLAGGGMLAGSPLSKHRLASMLLVALSDAARRMGDTPRVLIHQEEQEDRLLTDRTRHAPHRLYATLSQLPLEGRHSRIHSALQILQSRLRRRTFIVFVGDFFEPMDLSSLASRHELLALQVRTPEEIDPVDSGLYRDPASQKTHRLLLDPTGRRRYRERLESLDRENHLRLGALGIPLGRFRTDEDPFPTLATLLGARR